VPLLPAKAARHSAPTRGIPDNDGRFGLESLHTPPSKSGKGVSVCTGRASGGAGWAKSLAGFAGSDEKVFLSLVRPRLIRVNPRAVVSSSRLARNSNGDSWRTGASVFLTARPVLPMAGPLTMRHPRPRYNGARHGHYCNGRARPGSSGADGSFVPWESSWRTGIFSTSLGRARWSKKYLT
jgi:hypothetical protein